MSRAMGAWRGLVVLSLAVSALLVSARPCSACSCALQPPKALVRNADVAFIGTVTAQRSVDEITTIQSVVVDEVFRGSVPSRLDLVADLGPGGGSTCAVLFPIDAEVAVVAHERDDGTYATDSCSLISVAELRSVGGTPIEPLPSPASPTPGTVPDTGPVAPAATSGVPWQVVVLGALAGVAAIAVAIVLAGRRDDATPLGAAADPSGEDAPADPDADHPEA